MKEVYRDSRTTIFENSEGVSFGISQDYSRKGFYYSVIVRKPGEKGKNIATRCTYEKAVEIVKGYR